MYREARIVSSKEDLTALLKAKPRRIALRLARLDPDQTLLWEGRLNRHLSDCGCATGAIFMFGGIAAYGAGIFLDAALLPTGWLGRALFGLLVLVTSVCIGKAAGLLWSRRQFKAAVRDLQQAIADK